MKNSKPKILVLFLSCLLFLVLLGSLPHETILTSIVALHDALITSHSPPQTSLNLHSVSEGHWVASPAHRNDTLNWGINSPNHDCLTPSVLVDGGFRAQDVDGWEWVLSDGGALVDFDVEKFVIRGLQSRIGYVMVGDSLTDGIFVAMHMMLCIPPAESPRLRLMTRSYEFGLKHYIHATPGERDVYVNFLTMDLSHPLARELIARWETGDDEDLKGIPRERFENPVVRFYRSSNLASEEEMDEVLNGEMGVGVDLTAHLRTLAPWRDSLMRIVEEPRWDGEKSGIAIINTGPHWVPDRIKPIRENQTIEAYRRVMEKVYSSLPELSASGLNLRILYRSTMAPHENCERYLYPATIHENIALDPVGGGLDMYHWGWFEEYNEIAKEIWGGGGIFEVGGGDDLEEIRKREIGGVTTEYWDVWNLSATRPDAHVAQNDKNLDCLHFCPGGVYEWVARAWWHTIVTGGY